MLTWRRIGNKNENGLWTSFWGNRSWIWTLQAKSINDPLTALQMKFLLPNTFIWIAIGNVFCLAIFLDFRMVWTQMTTIWWRLVGNYSLSTPSNAMIDLMLLETRVMLMLLKYNLFFCFDFFFQFSMKTCWCGWCPQKRARARNVDSSTFLNLRIQRGLICQIKVCNFVLW